MAEAIKRQEKILELPLSKLEHLNGFALDFGGSVLKIAYLSKEDWKDGKPVFGDLGKVRLISFAREEFDEGLEFLKTNCFMRRNSEDDTPLMYTTGLGGAQYGKKIEEVLNIRTENTNEMDCFQLAVEYFVDNMSLEESCVEIPKEIYERQRLGSRLRSERWMELGKQGMMKTRLKENTLEIYDKEYDPSSNIRPYLLGIFGSAFGVMQFTEDGGHFPVTVSMMGGKSFLGLGSLLTGAKTYEELIELAEKGDNLNLDFTSAAVTQKTKDSKDDKDIYHGAKGLPPRPIFYWGKAFGKDLSEFKKEDLARTLLYTMCQNVVSILMDACLISRVKHVFAAESFISHPLTQSLVVEEFEHRKWQNAAFLPGVDGDYHLHILKHGSHLGALGGFLGQINNTSEH